MHRRIKTLLFYILFIILSLSIFAQQGEPSTLEDNKVYTVRNITIIGLDKHRTQKVIEKLSFLIKSGFKLNGKEIKRRIKYTESIVLTDPNYNYFEVYHETDGDNVDIELHVGGSDFFYIFGGGELYFKIGYRNIAEEGSKVESKLGYNIQNILFDFPYINGSYLGMGFGFEHSLINKYSPSKFISDLNAQYNIYIKPTPRLTMGVEGRTDYFIRYSNKEKLFDTGLGAFLKLDYMHLLNIMPYGFSLRLDYMHYFLTKSDRVVLDVQNTFSFGKYKNGMEAGNAGLDANFTFSNRKDDFIHRNESIIGFSGLMGSYAMNLHLWTLMNLAQDQGGNIIVGLFPSFMVSWVGDEILDKKPINIQNTAFAIGLGISLYAPVTGVKIIPTVYYTYNAKSIPANSRHGLGLAVNIK